jgi:hypothetical protein
MATKPITCGTISFKTDRYQSGPHAVLIDVDAYMEGKKVGGAGMLITDYGPEKLAVVSAMGAHIKRCRVGTRLYEHLYNIACAERALLASDSKRTEASEGFWRKQTRKGRAHCLTRAIPGTRLSSESPLMFKPVGNWPCYRYAMHEACPRKIDLSGRGRR